MNDDRDHYEADPNEDDHLEPMGPDDFPESNEPPAFEGDDLDDEPAGVYPDDEAETVIEGEEPAEGFDPNDPPESYTPPAAGGARKAKAAKPARSGAQPSRKRAAVIALGITGGLGALTAGGAWFAMGGLSSGPSDAEIEQAMARQQAAETADEPANSANNAQQTADEAVVAQIEASQNGGEAEPSASVTRNEPGNADTNVADEPTGPIGMDREAVIALIDERIAQTMDTQTGGVDTGRLDRLAEGLNDVRAEVEAMDPAGEAAPASDEALESVRDRLDAMASRIDSMAEASAQTPSVPASVAERLERLEQAVAADGSGNGAAAPDALVERVADLEGLEGNVYTALANSRLAVDAVRNGAYTPSKDWREIADAGPDESPQDASARADTGGKAQTDKALTGWDLVAIGDHQAMIRSPNGATYRVEPGDRVENLGDVRAIRVAENVVVLRDGVIRGG